MKQPTIVSIINHKGGVFKTSLTASLGAGLARVGKRVLVMDIDHQMDLTKSLFDITSLPTEGPQLSECVLNKESLDKLILPTRAKDLDIIPSDEGLVCVDIALVNQMGRENNLKTCFKETTKLAEYDFLLIDHPPSLALLVTNALVASDYFLVPVAAEYLALSGLMHFANTVTQVRDLNPYLEFLGVVVTDFSARRTICRQTEQKLRRSEIAERVFETMIRTNTKGAQCPAVQKTIFDYEKSPKGRGTIDYTALTKEFLERLFKMQVNVAIEASPKQIAANE